MWQDNQPITEQDPGAPCRASKCSDPGWVTTPCKHQRDKKGPKKNECSRKYTPSTVTHTVSTCYTSFYLNSTCHLLRLLWKILNSVVDLCTCFSLDIFYIFLSISRTVDHSNVTYIAACKIMLWVWYFCLLSMKIYSTAQVSKSCSQLVQMKDVNDLLMNQPQMMKELHQEVKDKVKLHLNQQQLVEEQSQVLLHQRNTITNLEHMALLLTRILKVIIGSDHQRALSWVVSHLYYLTENVLCPLLCRCRKPTKKLTSCSITLTMVGILQLEIGTHHIF